VRRERETLLENFKEKENAWMAIFQPSKRLTFISIGSSSQMEFN